MKDTEIILKQVALKGAVELLKYSFKTDDTIQDQLSVVKSVSNSLFEYLKDGVDMTTPEVKVPFETEPPNEPISNSGNTQSYDEKLATYKQKKFVNSLFYKLPQSIQDEYKDKLDSKSMTMQLASDLIKKFQAIIDEKSKSDLPF